MAVMDPEALVRRIALEQGVNPDLAVSIWRQESGGSTDTALRGQELSRGRGAAVGPFQVVPYYHPEFPVNGTFEDQARYATKYLGEVGPARYYGTGKAPPGQPTTEQYVNQVMSRMPQDGLPRPDVRMASNDPQNAGMGLPTGDPRTGIADPRTGPMGVQMQPPTMDPRMGMLVPSAEIGMLDRMIAAEGGSREPDTAEDFMGEPLLHIGLSLLANSGSRKGGPLAGVARGVQQGLTNYAAVKELRNKSKREGTREMLEMARQKQEWARMMGIGGLSPSDAVNATGNAQIFVNPDGTDPVHAVFDRSTRKYYRVGTGEDASQAIAGKININDLPSSSRGAGAVDTPSSWILSKPDGSDPVSFYGTEEAASAKAAAEGKIQSKPSTYSRSGGGGGAGKEQQAKVDALISARKTVAGLKDLALGVGDPASPNYKPGAFEAGSNAALLGKRGDAGVFDRAMTGLSNLWRQVSQNPGETQQAEYTRALGAIVPELAKSFGHQGVLSDKDIWLTLSALPKADSYPDTRAFAIDVFARLEKQLDAKIAAMAGESQGTLPPTMSNPVPTAAGGAFKPLEQMTDEEKLQELQQLEGGR